MGNPKYTERFSVGFTPEQVRRLHEIVKVRAHKGQRLSKADVVRDAVGFYLLHQEDLPGSRKAIAKAVEGKIAEVDAKVTQIDTKLTNLVAWLEARSRR
jgi:hypothetical protein